MSKPCDNLTAFLDRELSGTQEAEFRIHLPRCPDCQRRLLDRMQLAALAAEVDPAVPSAPASRSSFRPRWARRTLMGVAVLAAVATITAFAPLPASFWSPDLATRSIDARLARAPRHLPYDVPRSERNATSLGLAARLLLTIRGDALGMAEAHLARGNLDEARRSLAEAEPGPDTHATEAAVAWNEGRHSRALDLLDQVLQEEPMHAQAWWNRALILDDLGLSMMASSAFTRIAELGEPGWSDEARMRADALRERVRDEAGSWYAGREQVKAMVGADGPVPAEKEIVRHPGTWRWALYDAVRASQSRAQVERLLPVAEVLDQLAAHGDPSVRPDLLASYVRWAAARDFRYRAPLGERYRRLYQKELPAGEIADLVATLRRGNETDLLIGATIQGGKAGTHESELVALASATQDPWLRLVAVEETANALIAAGRYGEAGQRLIREEQTCRGAAMASRCAYLEIRLAEVYSHLHQPEEAQEHAQHAWLLSRQSQEWGLQLAALQHLGQIARLRRELAPMRAYLEEARARASLAEARAQAPRADLCEVKNTVRELLASEYLLRLRPDDAAREMAPDLDCDSQVPVSVFRAMVLVNVARQRRDTAALERFRLEMEALQHSPELTPGQRLLGRQYAAETARLRGDPSALAEMEEVIRSADGLLAQDVDAQKARASAFTSLVREAGRQEAHLLVLQRIASERSIQLSAQCILAVDAQDETVVLAGRDGAGQLFGRYRDDLKERASDVRALVPGEIIDRLRPCPAVEVLARAPINGRPGLLPAEIAWSYRLGPRAGARGTGVRLIVTGVDPPAHLKLARLRDWDTGQANIPGTVLLHGANATPSQVLAQMKDAGEIWINAHGLSGTALSDAAIIALSPEAGGRYALLAKDVRAQRLLHSPVVVLAACHAANSAPYPHVPTSLPAAFIDAGARVVLAPAVEVPDASQAEFFEAVLARIRAGELPAVAARDERTRWAQRGEKAAWTRDVLVFD
jgi:hypothetical protein